MSSSPGAPGIPTLLDDQVLADLREDFASTGDLGELATLIRNFVERAAEGVAEVAAAVESGDGDAVRKAGHKLKGSSQTLGAALLGAVAAKVEAAGADDDPVTARRRAHELEIVFGLTRHALSDVVKAIGGEAEPGPGSAGGDAARASAGDAADDPSLRALIADDEPVALAVLLATVERLGHACTAVTDGEAALASYERERPQVVITEMQMPGLAGVELAGRIRELDGAAPYVAVLSATGDPAGEAPGRAVDAVLSKPVREDELRALFGLAARRGA